MSRDPDELDRNSIHFGAFREWALREGGRPARDDRGEVELAKGRPMYSKVDEATADMEENVLKQLNASLVDQGRTPSEIPQALDGFKRYLETKVRGRDLNPDLKGKAKEQADRKRRAEAKKKGMIGVSPATIERYLVVCRRYYRFHREVVELDPVRPAAKSERFKGPILNSNRRGRVMKVEQFNSWLASVDGNPRLTMATWLLIAGVPIDKVTSLRFGVELVREGRGIRIAAPFETRELEGAGQEAISAEFQDGSFAFVSDAPSSRGAAMSTAGLRKLWTNCRKRRLEDYGDPGPTMRDLKTLGDRTVLTEGRDGWTLAAPTYTAELNFRD